MTIFMQAAIIVVTLLVVFWSGFFLGMIVNRPKRKPMMPELVKPISLDASDKDKRAWEDHRDEIRETLVQEAGKTLRRKI